MSEIKDSGERREFETGAVRDMREGKGRFDLMPLEEMAYIMDDDILADISMFFESKDTIYLKNAIKTFSHSMYPFDEKYEFQCLANAFLETAVHFEAGAKKYGENNWRKGLPISCYIDSAVRHYMKFLRGDDDEPHARAFIWNLLCCMWTVNNLPETKTEEWKYKNGKC